VTGKKRPGSFAVFRAIPIKAFISIKALLPIETGLR
jgi:hypothetical protein